MSQTGGASVGIFSTTVSNQRLVCREHFELTLAVPSFPVAQPGHFVQVLCRDESTESPAAGDAMLRRPFSIGGLRGIVGGVEIDILGRVVGPGTAWLGRRRAGDRVSILGPLGRAFAMPTNDDIAILVAGGVGLPPIRWLGETLCESGRRFTFIYGAQSRDLLALELAGEPSRDGKTRECISKFAGFGVGAAITTDDGSCGLRGRVTEVLKQELACIEPRRARVYACGPEPMLRAVSAMCAGAGAWCEVAMERVMGCGMGTCQSCVVPVKDDRSAEGWRYALCCREGPVFDGAQVVW